MNYKLKKLIILLIVKTVARIMRDPENFKEIQESINYCQPYWEDLIEEICKNYINRNLVITTEVDC